MKRQRTMTQIRKDSMNLRHFSLPKGFRTQKGTPNGLPKSVWRPARVVLCRFRRKFVLCKKVSARAARCEVVSQPDCDRWRPARWTGHPRHRPAAIGLGSRPAARPPSPRCPPAGAARPGRTPAWYGLQASGPLASALAPPPSPRRLWRRDGGGGPSPPT